MLYSVEERREEMHGVVRQDVGELAAVAARLLRAGHVAPHQPRYLVLATGTYNDYYMAVGNRIPRETGSFFPTGNSKN